MSLDSLQTLDEPITQMGELEDYFRSAEKPRSMHRVGLEHEKFLYPIDGATPVPYEGAMGVQALFDRMASSMGYREFRENPEAPVIALTQNERTVSLEPGGQLELSGSPFFTAREAHAENQAHLLALKPIAQSLGLQMVALGYRPVGEPASMPWMPKSRYRAMKASLGSRGQYALDMMLMTATGQVSLDWEDEADCARKMTLAARMSPLLTAMFANSPLRFGQPSGMMSFRSHVWTDVDPARCGYLRCMLDGNFTYRAYIEWALDAPLLFLRRSGQYLLPRMTFRQLLKDGFEGAPARMSDWVDHCSTLFPEVRIKKLLEIRAADCVGLPLTGALPALCRGLLYDAQALTEALTLLPEISLEAQLEFAQVARTQGLRGHFRKQSLAGWAQALVDIAQKGLSRLDRDDRFLLEPLAAQVASGRSPAEDVLEAWERQPEAPALLRAFSL